ncbi:hypothetical protein XELAEV_18002082mg [Xenopus laevis]|nr:hypothetical protein XELAEV_18002082mg [Xenopus laevis]
MRLPFPFPRWRVQKKILPKISGGGNILLGRVILPSFFQDSWVYYIYIPTEPLKVNALLFSYCGNCCAPYQQGLSSECFGP